MHSAIFTLIDVSGKENNYSKLKKTNWEQDPGEIYDYMNNVADYVGGRNGWDTAMLLDYIGKKSFITIEDDRNQVFSIDKDKNYIKQALIDKSDEIRSIIDRSADNNIFHSIKNIIEDRHGYYIKVIDQNNELLSFDTLNSFLYDGRNVGKAFMIVSVNDYHY